MAGFQGVVYQYPPLAEPGDFASANPRASAIAGDSALIADPTGLTVGKFAWIDSTGQLARNFGSGAPSGFVHRNLQAVITIWLGQSSMVIPAGLPVALLNEGDFWTRCGSAFTAGQKAFADLSNGNCVSGTAGGGTIAAAAGTGAVALVNGAGVLTISAVTTAGFVAGQGLTGANIPTGQTIVAQLTGTAQGVGTYSVSLPVVSASATIAGDAAAETTFYIRNSGNAGELAKISTWGKN